MLDSTKSRLYSMCNFNQMILKTKKISVALIFFLSIGMIPIGADALIPPLRPFGGTARTVYPCTCSKASYLYFAPLFLSAIPVMGTMAFFQSGTYQYANYLGGSPKVQYLGAYMPGVQACWMYAGYSCYPLPTVGVMTFIGTGTGDGKK